MTTEVAHDQHRIRCGLDEKMQSLEHHLFRNRVPRIGRVEHT